MPDSAHSASPSQVRLPLAAALGPLDRDVSGPLYVQLQRALRDAIHNEQVSADEALPPERDLADELNVSRITVRKAFEGLVNEGLLVRRRGSGTFVANRMEKSFAKLTSFTEDMRARGHKPRTVWLSRARGIVTPEEALYLGLSPLTEVYRFERVRYADDTVMALEYDTIPAHCLPSLEAVGESLYDALEKTGYRPVRALQRLRGVAFSPDQAEKMGVAPGHAGLFIERHGFSADGRSCELSRSYYRGDTYDVIAELSDS